MRACLFAKRMGFEAEPYLAVVWRHLNVRGDSKMIREGPDKCILTDMTFVWCFTRGEPVRLKPVCTQLVVAKDKILLRFSMLLRIIFRIWTVAFVTTPDSSLKKGTSEFATLCVDNDKTELKAKGRFALSSARKSRMFRAHLAQSPVSELLIDRRVLTAYYENQPYDENRPVLSYISNMEDSTRTKMSWECSNPK